MRIYLPVRQNKRRHLLSTHLPVLRRPCSVFVAPGSTAVFDPCRNIIDFRLGGDPRLLLRAINPGEAALFDRAAGVHLRFRLGGYTFPPSIYYKVWLSPSFAVALAVAIALVPQQWPCTWPQRVLPCESVRQLLLRERGLHEGASFGRN